MKPCMFLAVVQNSNRSSSRITEYNTMGPNLVQEMVPFLSPPTKSFLSLDRHSTFYNKHFVDDNPTQYSWVQNMQSKQKNHSIRTLVWLFRFFFIFASHLEVKRFFLLRKTSCFRGKIHPKMQTVSPFFPAQHNTLPNLSLGSIEKKNLQPAKSVP